MTVGELITSVRYDLNDPQGIEFSDQELIEYINRSQEWINQELIELGSYLVAKKTTLTLTNNETDLPADFVKEISVKAGNLYLRSVVPYEELPEDGYQIIGGKLRAKADTVELTYFYTLPSYSAKTDTIVLPQPLHNILRLLVVIMAKNRIEIPSRLELAFLQDLRRRLMSYAEVGKVAVPTSSPVRF